MTCQQIESLLPPFVDGSATPEDARRVSIHVATCEDCRRVAEAQRIARTVLRARASHLSPIAPPGLRTRLTAVTESRKPQESLGWQGRLSAIGAAVLVVLVVGALLLPVLTGRSTVLLAAQLALDHLKCFVIDGDAVSAPITSAQAEETLRTLYGWNMRVPAPVASDGLQLVAVRRCLYGDGYAAHLLYRMDGDPVSLFIMPGLARPAADAGVFGHTEIVWSGGDNTYMLVAGAGKSDRLQRVASHFRIEAQ